MYKQDHTSSKPMRRLEGNEGREYPSQTFWYSARTQTVPRGCRCNRYYIEQYPKERLVLTTVRLQHAPQSAEAGKLHLQRAE
eukprot:2840779-Pleurochrysis_carterae.AAC.6